MKAFHFLHDYYQKQNAFKVCILWVAFVLFRSVLKESLRKIISMYKRNHVTIWNWIQKYHPKTDFIKTKKDFRIHSWWDIAEGWLWVVIESETRQILALSISKERNMLIAERFLSDIVKIHGKHPVSTDGGTWYPQACKFLNLNHHIHSSMEKSLIERELYSISEG